jgi:hypothetical protein
VREACDPIPALAVAGRGTQHAGMWRSPPLRLSDESVSPVKRRSGDLMSRVPQPPADLAQPSGVRVDRIIGRVGPSKDGATALRAYLRTVPWTLRPLLAYATCVFVGAKNVTLLSVLVTHVQSAAGSYRERD